MSAFDEIQKLNEAPEVKPEPKILTLKDALDQMNNITKNMSLYTSENDKKLTETTEGLMEKKAEVEAVLERFKSFANDTLPLIIKKNFEVAITADFKSIAKTESDEFNKRMLTALDQYEERIKRASDSIVKRNEASLTNRIMTGGFWLIVAVTFSVAFFRFSGWQANRHATADAEFGRKAKVVIESWQAPARKSFLELIEQTK